MYSPLQMLLAILTSAVGSLLVVFILATSNRLHRALKWFLQHCGAIGHRALGTMLTFNPRDVPTMEHIVRTPSLLLSYAAMHLGAFLGLLVLPGLCYQLLSLWADLSLSPAPNAAFVGLSLLVTYCPLFYAVKVFFDIARCYELALRLFRLDATSTPDVVAADHGQATPSQLTAPEK